MRHEDEVEPLVERWLKEEARPMPPHVLSAVREAVPRVRQRAENRFVVIGRWWPGYGRVALAVAAVAALLLVGPAALDRLRGDLHAPIEPGAGVGGPGSAPSVGPTVAVNPTESIGPSTDVGSPPAATSSFAAGPSAPVVPSHSFGPGGSPSSTSDPFSGTWVALDVDGSQETLTFSGSGATRTVVMEDLRASACAGGHYLIQGVGTITRASIHVVGWGGCAGGSRSTQADVTWIFDPAAGSITDPADSAGVIWSRGPARPDAFSGRWTATGAGGSSMRLAFDGSGMTRDVSFSADGTTDCGPGVTFSATGTGTIGSVLGEGRYIRVSLHGSCAGGGSPMDSIEKYRYDHGTDTLSGPLAPLESGGNPLPGTMTWHRP